MDKNQVVRMLLHNPYYSIDDLRYNRKIGILFSREDFSQFLATKDQLIDEQCSIIEKLPLKTFNSKHCFFVEGNYLTSLQSEYLRILLSDLKINHSYLFSRVEKDLLISRLFSEVEGSLRIENVPTTHQRIAEIHASENLEDINDIIVKNMLDAINFILTEKPAFNKDNLKKLYNILSNNCLPEEITLSESAYYRDDKVYIGDFEGADCSIIEECMDSLFAFANDESCIQKYRYLLPYICHYYILYIHPYFDFNGRTARMVSFWLSHIYNIPAAPYFMSEAINENKSEYYRAITDTRNTNNDLTYFLGYIMKTAIRFTFIYKNLEEIKNILKKTGDALTSAEWVYVKKILVHNPEEFFTYKMFLEYINTSMSRQGVFRILNNLEKYDILLKSKNKKGNIIFKMNPELVIYKYNE